MGDRPADDRGRERRGHAFQDIEGELRCGHCGQTAENFRTYQNDCAVPQCLRYEQPALDDKYAVVCWETGVGSFWRTLDEAEAFRQAEPEGEWIGPLPLLSLSPTADRAATHVSFEQYLVQRGQPRDARSVSVGETLTETMREVERPLNSLAECYLREDHLWTQLKQSAKEETGHFISDLADPEPNRILSQVACDFDRTARAAGYGAMDVARLFNSVNFHLHIVRFATTLARHASDDAIDRAVYWVLLNCHFYARHLAHEMDKVDGHGRELLTLGGVPKGSRYGASIWDEITIMFISDERIQIHGPAVSETLNYQEFCLVNSKTGTPNLAWETLRRMAENSGFIQANFPGKAREKLEKRVQEIRKAFRHMFGIASDPIEFIAREGYQAQFRIGCAASYEGGKELDRFSTL